MKGPIAPTTSPGVELAIAQFRGVLRQAGPAVLAAVYRNVALQTHHAAQEPTIKRTWADTLELLNMSSDEDVAAAFLMECEKTIVAASGDPRTLKDYMAAVTTGIIAISKGRPN